MPFETELGTSRPAPAPETAPAQTERRDNAPAAQPAKANEPRGRLPSGDELRARAIRDFEAARSAAAKAKNGEGGSDKKPDGKADGGKSGHGGSKADHGRGPAKADGKAPEKATHGPGARDEHGRFASGEGGAQRQAPGKAEAPVGKAESGERSEEAGKAPPKPRARDVDGRDPTDPHAKVTDEQLRDDAELDRRFAALNRQSRQARDRAEQAAAQLRQLEEKRAAFAREQEAAKADPDRLNRRELADLAQTDPVALLERLGIDASAFNRALLTSGTEAARVDRIERQLREREAAAERQAREAEEAGKRRETEEAEARRRQAAEEAEQNWSGVQEMLTSDDSRPALAKLAGKSFAFVRHRLEDEGRKTLTELARANRMPEDRIDALLTPDQRRQLFARTLDRLEDEFADTFGVTKPGLVIDQPGARGGPSAESGAGPRSAHQAPPEGTQTLTPRMASESSPPRFPVVKTANQLRIEALRAFERASGGRLAQSH